MSEYDYTLSFILIGDSCTGTEEFCREFSSSFFKEDLKITLGVDFYSKILYFEESKVKLQLWDFGGEERFKFLLSQYCRSQHGAIIMYDITNSNTLTQIPDWLQIIRKNTNDIPIILVGNKFNLDEPRMVSRQEGIRIAEKYNLTAFAEISTKTGENVEKVFQVLTEIIMR